MKSITEIKDFEGKKVFVRVDWNIAEGDTSRIEDSLETIQYIKDHDGKPLIASHFGRDGESIQTVIDFAKRNFPILAKGIDYIENLRSWQGEAKNDFDFAKWLVDGASYYVNEAFAVSHREHASIVSLPKILPGYAGINFLREVEHLSKAFNPPHPFLLILGGTKFETKLPLINKFLDIADEIFIGGAMKVHQDLAPESQKITFSPDPTETLDAGPESIELLRSKILASKFVLWNGPLGQFESGHRWGTEQLAKILSACDAEVIVGGGDTVAAIKSLNIENKFTWVSTAGGAMLDFLATGTLPGIEALN